MKYSLVAANCIKLSLWASKAVIADLRSSDHWVRASSLVDVLIDGRAVPTLDGCDIIKVLCLCVEGQVEKRECCEEKGRPSGAVLIPCRLEPGLDTSTDTTDSCPLMNGDGSSMSKGDRGARNDR